MHIRDIFSRRRPIISFEFFPPRTAESAEKLFQTIVDLEAIAPDFVSITYGAGGSTRELTHDLVAGWCATTSLNPVPHLTCVGHSAEEIERILERYAAAGVGNILALRGDFQRDGHGVTGDFRYAADLVRAIRGFHGHRDPRGFGIGVAGFPEGHPDTPNRLLEMDHLKAKVDAGADYICTQVFFENRDFHDFRARCELAGIRVPIIAGIMPITTISGLKRMADLAGGARFPARLLKALNRAGGDQDAIRRIGIHYAAEQCVDLLHHGVDGLHFYTLNQSGATKEILANLGDFRHVAARV